VNLKVKIMNRQKETRRSMVQGSRRLICSIISGLSFLFWVVGIGLGNFLLTLISGVCFILFLILASASVLPPPPPETSIPPPPPPE
jgi:hypothetical protein